MIKHDSIITLLFLLLFLTCGQHIFAQATIDTTVIKKELSAIFDRDQKTRTPIEEYAKYFGINYKLPAQ